MFLDQIPHHRHPCCPWSTVQWGLYSTDFRVHQRDQTVTVQAQQHRRAGSSGQDSAVHLNIKDKGDSSSNENVQIVAREDRWFEKRKKSPHQPGGTITPHKYSHVPLMSNLRSVGRMWTNSYIFCGPPDLNKHVFKK